MWYACAVISDFHSDAEIFSAPIDLGNGVCIEKIPSWVKSRSALKNLSWSDRNAIKEAGFVFSFRYDAEALGSPDPNWNGRDQRGIQSVVDEKFALAALALWLVIPSRLIGRQLLHFSREGDSESLRSFALLNRILIADFQLDNIPTAEQFLEAKNIFSSILTLPRRGTLWTSVRVLMRACVENMWETRYLMFWIVLEALFGPDDSREITHRISQRISLFTGKNASECKDVFKNARDGYQWRSKIAHGMRLAKMTTAKSKELMIFVDEVIRTTLLKVLRDRTLATQFDGKKREEYLDMQLYDRLK